MYSHTANHNRYVQGSQRQKEAAAEVATEALHQLRLHARGLAAFACAAAAALTPGADASATGAHATITQPSAPSEGASADAAAIASEVDKQRQEMEKHLLRTRGMAAVDAALQYLRLSELQDAAGSSNAGAWPPVGEALSPVQRTCIIGDLPADLAPAARQAVEVRCKNCSRRALAFVTLLPLLSDSVTNHTGCKLRKHTRSVLGCRGQAV